MPYRMLEEFQSRRKEKVAAFLTFENIVGLILVAFPFFVGSAGLPLLIRAPLVLGAALFGVFVTLEIGGLSLYEKLIWRGRGLIRLRTRGDVITPEDLTGAARSDDQERPLPLDGPIQIATRERGSRVLRHLEGDVRTPSGRRQVPVNEGVYADV
jgi:hypothetical protein